MNTLTVSATHARNNFFELLDLVAAGRTFVVAKDRKVVARMVPAAREVSNNKGLMKALRAAAKGFVYKQSENPLRMPGAAAFLGKWDQS